MEFARGLRAPVTVALHGDLGMGKSEIARSVIQELCGADTVVPSPTFTIVQNYIMADGRCMTADGFSTSTISHLPSAISHFDLYRVNDVSELTEIGLPYAMEHDITLVEWPEIAADLLPENTIHIYITEFEEGRKFIIHNA